MKPLTRFEQEIARAVDERNAFLAGRIAEKMRFVMGATHAEIFERVQKVRPELTLPEWEALLLESEETP